MTRARYTRYPWVRPLTTTVSSAACGKPFCVAKITIPVRAMSIAASGWWIDWRSNLCVPPDFLPGGMQAIIDGCENSAVLE